jgi:hypothetical protein
LNSSFGNGKKVIVGVKRRAAKNAQVRQSAYYNCTVYVNPFFYDI